MGEPSTYQECTIGMIPDSIPKARQDAKIERSQHRDQYFWTPNGQRTPSKHITTPHNHSGTQLHFERQQTLHQVAHKPRFASPPFKLAGPNASHSRALEYFVAFSRRRLPPDGCDFSQLGHAPILDMFASHKKGSFRWRQRRPETLQVLSGRHRWYPRPDQLHPKDTRGYTHPIPLTKPTPKKVPFWKPQGRAISGPRNTFQPPSPQIKPVSRR